MKKCCSTLAVLLAALSVPRAWAVTVTTLNDSGDGSLRAALGAGGNIEFAVTGTITLTSGELVINDSITITGPGADQLTIARSSEAGAPEFRVLTVNGNVTISGVTFRNGRIGSADGYENGGGILVRGGLTLVNCAVTDNRSVGGWTRGTGIYINGDGRLIAVNCLFARNHGEGFDSEGSAIYNFGSLALTNCTFSGNSAGYSAAIQNDAFSAGIVIDSCTIFGNRARLAPALMNGVNGSILLRNSIVAGNSAWDGDWEIESRGHITSAGYNLIGFVYHAPDMDPVTPHPTDHVGLSAAQLHLAPLADNGGPTFTHALFTNSPALDAGPTNGFPAADQRGVARPQFAGCDIGALEADSFPPPATNHPPVANAQNVTAHLGTPLPITLTGSDADGDPLTYSIATLPVWGTLSGTPPNVIYTPATNSPDWDFFAFSVNDGQADSTPAAVNITVLPKDLPPTNQPPTITIVSPANGATFTAPANILLIASVHDPDGIAAAATVEFFAGTNKLGDGQLFDPGPLHEAPFHLFWTNVLAGEYDLTAKVTDDQGATAVSAPVTIRAQGADNLPVVRITATDPNAAEPDDPGTFTVFRDGSTNNTLNVYYLIGGTASNGVDYVTLSNWVTVPAGIRSAQISVAPIDDLLVEGLERVAIRLVPPPILPPATYIIGSPSNAVVTILDNDPPPNPYQPIVTIEATDAHASEPGMVTVIDPGIFTVYRAGNTSATLYVHYRIEGTAANGLDYTTLSNTVVIPAGATSARILINPLHDLLAEGTETVVLRLEEPICIAIFPPPPDCYRVGTPGNATVYIADNDAEPTNHPPTVHIFTPTNGASFVAPADIFIAANAQDVDGYLTIQTVEFFAGTNSLGIRTNYPTLDPIGPFRLVWTNVPPGNYVLTAKATDSGGASGISPPVEIRVGGTNQPPTNLLPIVTITAPDAIASEGTNWYCWPGRTNHSLTNFCLTNTATFVVRRTGDTNTPLSVLYEIRGTASNGVDYAALPDSVIIPAGRHSAEIRIVPIDDTLPEYIETVVLSLVAPPASPTVPPPYALGRPHRAAAIIVDNDQPRPSTGMLPDHNFHIMRPGDNGTWWRIECSTNLVQWSVLGTNSVTDGAIHFVDPDGDELPQRFYRAVPELNPPAEEP